MLKIVKNAISDSDIKELQSLFSAKMSAKQFNIMFDQTSSEMIEHVFGVYDVEKLIQQIRYPVHDSRTRDIIFSAVKRNYQTTLPQSTLIYLVRSFWPIPIHIDVDHQVTTGSTIMMPLFTQHAGETLVWKEAMDIDQFNDFIQEFSTNCEKMVPKMKISDRYPLNHCWSSSPHLADYLELDGVAPWEEKSMFCFDRRQLHASTNFKSYYPFKDYVLLHSPEVI